MSVTTTNLLMGPATIYVAPFGTAEPANAAAMVGAGWVDVGATDGGAKLTIDQTWTDLEVDQIGQSAGARITKQDYMIATTLAEATLANLRLATNLAINAAAKMTLNPLITTAAPNYVAVLLQGQKPGGGNRNVVIRRALSVESIELSYAKDDKTVIPITFKSYYVSSSIDPISIDETTT